MAAKFMLVWMIIGLLMATTSWAGTIAGKVTFLRKAQDQAAVYLEGVKGNTIPSGKYASMVQKKQLFIPAVLPVVKGTTVDFPNKDTVFHNAFSLSPGNNFSFKSYGPGENPHVQFNTLGSVDVFCNFHSQMHALILVLDHSYFALTSKKGAYEIKDIPTGTYQIKAWVGPDLSSEKTVIIGSSDTVNVDFDITK